MTAFASKTHLRWQPLRPCVALTLLLALPTFPVRAVTISGLYNTGVDDAGNLLPWHALDSHYQVSGAASAVYSAREQGTPGGLWYWADPPPGANWVGPNASDNLYPDDPVGDYRYSLLFDLTGLDPAQAQLAGYWGTDNSGLIVLNGVSTGFTRDVHGFIHFTPFLITSGFLAGPNLLEFVVHNSGGPSGLLVGGLVGTVGEPLTLPEVPYTTPGGPRGGAQGVPDGGNTAALLAAGFVGLHTLRPKRRGQQCRAS